MHTLSTKLKVVSTFAILLVASGPLRAGDVDYYIPVVYAKAPDPTTAQRLGSCDYRLDGSYWVSDISLYNIGSVGGSMRALEAFSSGQLDPGCNQLFTLPPGRIAGIGPCLKGATLGFLRLQASANVVVSATLSRIDFWPYSINLVGTDVSQGTTRLPVFNSLFPANSRTVTDIISFGYPGLVSCAPKNQQYVRRVNVTLCNAGTVPASFQVTATVRDPFNPMAAVSAFEQSYTVQPRDVLQVNGVQLAFPGQYPDGSWSPAADLWGWFFITADQPFLSYVSTVMNDPEPKALPFAVYPSKPIN